MIKQGLKFVFKMTLTTNSIILKPSMLDNNLFELINLDELPAANTIDEIFIIKFS